MSSRRNNSNKQLSDEDLYNTIINRLRLNYGIMKFKPKDSKYIKNVFLLIRNFAAYMHNNEYFNPTNRLNKFSKKWIVDTTMEFIENNITTNADDYQLTHKKKNDIIKSVFGEKDYSAFITKMENKMEDKNKKKEISAMQPLSSFESTLVDNIETKQSLNKIMKDYSEYFKELEKVDGGRSKKTKNSRTKKHHGK